MRITEEDFKAWLESPTTQEVFRAMQALSERARESWIDASWKQGKCDPVLLADLRARAEVAEDISTLSYEDIEHELERNQARGIQGVDQAG